MERIQENVGKNRRQKDEHHLDKKNDRKEKRKKQKKKKETHKKKVQKKRKRKWKTTKTRRSIWSRRSQRRKKREKGSEGALCLETRQGLFTVDGLSSVCLADVWLSPFSAGALVFIFDLCTLEKIV